MKKPLSDRIRKSWLVQLFEKEENRTIYEASTGRIRRKLTKRDALAITLMALISAFISAYVKFMQMARFSTFPSNDIFISWHPFAAPIALVGISLFIICCYAKGVDYWLVYFGAFMGIFYWSIELFMVHSIFTPQDLANFFHALGDLPEWLTGPRLP